MMIKNKEQENAKYAIEQEALKKHNLVSVCAILAKQTYG